MNPEADYRPVPFPEYADKYVFNVDDPNEIVNLDCYGTGRVARCKVTVDSTGHAMIRMTTKDGLSRSVRVAHMVWAYHNGPVPKGYVVHHINGNPDDNRVENLELLTPSQHCAQHNREKWDSGVFSRESPIRKPVIRVWPEDLHRPDERYASISEAAEKTGASLSAISLCCNGKLKTTKGCRWMFDAVNNPV